MRIAFNPTGTHTHKGYLKVRFDLIPDPTDKTYAMHHIQVPVIPPGGYPGAVDEMGAPIDQADYDKWLGGLPKVWQTNPCLSHIVTVPEDIQLQELENLVCNVFNKDTTATLDDILVQPDSAHLVSVFMRDKGIPSVKPVKAKDLVGLVSSVNARLAGLGLAFEGGGSVIPIEPQSIVVGYEAIDRAYDCYYTRVAQAVKALADGTIDTIEIFAASGYPLADCEVATFFVVSGNNLSTRDSELLGNVAAGSKQTITLNSVGGAISIDVMIDDCIGTYFSSGRLKQGTTTTGGHWWRSGDNIPCTDATFGINSNDISLKGTGTEAAGGWANIGKVMGVAAAAFGKMNGVAVADVKTVSGVAV